MTLREFAESNRLRFKLVEGEEIVLGKAPSHIYDYGEGQFGALVMHGTNAARWNLERANLAAAGCEIIQDGDMEGCALFDPANPFQVKAALKAIKARRRRVLTEEQREHLAAVSKSTRIR